MTQGQAPLTTRILDEQFILCKDQTLLPEGWPKRYYASWYLAVRPALPVVEIRAEDDSLAGYLLGYPINPQGQLVKGSVRPPSGPVILSWDQGQVHKGPAIRQVFLRYHRLQTEWFARYARNSIRPSRSGTSSRATRPTACRWTSRIFETAFIPILGGFAVAEPNYDLSFWLWNCSHRSVDAYSITFVRFESGGRCAAKGGAE